MKQRITLEDLAGLDQYQRDRLNELWTPHRYDLAAGFLCMDAENNKYDIFEFVIGFVNISETRAGYNMTLINLEAIRSLKAQSDEAETEESPEETDFEEFSEEDFIFEYERPDIYNKGDCLPLLTIGQMFELLTKCGYGNGDFYADFSKVRNEYGVGRNIEQYIDFGMDHINEELCDALWAALKEAL